MSSHFSGFITAFSSFNKGNEKKEEHINNKTKLMKKERKHGEAGEELLLGSQAR